METYSRCTGKGGEYNYAEVKLQFTESNYETRLCDDDGCVDFRFERGVLGLRLQPATSCRFNDACPCEIVGDAEFPFPSRNSYKVMNCTAS